MRAMKSVLVLIAIAGAQGAIIDTIDKICDLFSEMSDDKQELTPDEMKGLFAKFASMMADKVDCSEDPFNPVIGYNLKNASFSDCQAAKMKALSNPQAQFQLKSSKCIQKIADEADKSGAAWMEMSNTGKFKPEFTVRAAFRWSFDDDGKITAYHAVYDSYHVLNKGSGSYIKAALSKVCDVFDKMSSDKQDITPDQMKKIGGEFASLFADKVNCSEDPFNPTIGYNIHGEVFGKCMAAKKEALSDPDVQFQLGSTRCIEQIADAEANTGALWLELSNTGAFKKEFSVRAGVRYHFNTEGKITAYHAVYDSYHILKKDEDSRLASATPISGLGQTTLPSVALSAVALVGTFVLGMLVGRRDNKRSTYIGVALQQDEQVA
jgi:hypothetical protein